MKSTDEGAAHLPGTRHRLLNNLARQSFEVLVMVLAVLSGIGGLFSVGFFASPVHDDLPTWARFVWDVGLILGGCIVVAGIGAPRPIGFAVERAGLVVLMGPSLSYAVLALSVGAQGLFEAFFVVAFVVTIVGRLFVINREPKEVEKLLTFLRDQTGGEE